MSSHREDPEYVLEAIKDGFNIKLITQPTQSLDINVLDLGFFNAIQSLQDRIVPKHVKYLVKVVERAYNKFDPKLCNLVFLTLQ